MRMSQALRRLETIDQKLYDVLEPVVAMESPLNIKDARALAAARALVRKVLQTYGKGERA